VCAAHPLFALLTAIAGAISVTAQPVVYVRAGASGAGDGTSWQDAYPELQSALSQVAAPAEIWVASSVYQPTVGVDRLATFQLRSGVAVYGGFVGTEDHRDERDWAVHETVLSGEIGSPTTPNDNSYHVVTGSGTDTTAVLDGFTITAGRANGTGGVDDPLRVGAGMYNVGGGPTIRHVVFRGNAASLAGSGVWNDANSSGRFDRVWFDGNQMFNRESDPVVSDALFENVTTVGSGGGVANSGASPYIERATFRNNTARDGGGMINAAGSAPVCVDCDFEDNRAVGTGGAVYNQASAPLFVRSAFEGNTSPNGGGALFNEEAGSDMVCIDCHFRNNSTSNGSGGAVYLRLFAHLTFIDAVFEGNAAADGRGGAVFSESSSEPHFVNTVFVGNQARTGGAATLLTGSRRLVNVTFAGNRSQLGGGALEIGFGETEVLNSVLWDNGRFDGQPGEILHTGGALTMRHSLVSGGCGPPFTCEAVIDVDPLFVRPPAWIGTMLVDGGDLRLRAGSPAIDAGLAAYLPADIWDLDDDGDTTELLPLDILGQPRVQGADVDLGAYEGGVLVAGEPAVPPAQVAVRVAPNPAAGAATVMLDLLTAGPVDVAILDVLGRRVATLHAGALPAGRHAFTWGDRAPAGVYAVRVRSDSASLTRRLTLSH